MAPKKNRCNFKECQSAAQRIVGDCGFCQGHFCSKHRLLEDHKCEGLEDVGIPDFDFAQLSTSSSSATSSSSSQTTFSSMASSSKDPQWWLVGLCDSLASDDVADLFCSSARSNPMSETPHSSRVSAPRSLRVFNENYDDEDEDDVSKTSSNGTAMGGT